MIFFRVSLLILLSVCIYCPTAHATITITGNSLQARAAGDFAGGQSPVHFGGKSIPTNPDPYHLEDIDGDSYSKNVIDWSVVGGQTIFSFDINLKRTGDTAAFAWFLGQDLKLVVNETTPYELSGYLHVTDVGATESGRVEQFVRLYDDTGLDVDLFSSELQSINTHNEQFTLGVLGADKFNIIEPGSKLSGNLVPGRPYALRFIYHISTSAAFPPSETDSGASAVGNLTLKLGTVPEPSSLALLLTLGLIRLRRRRTGAVKD